jgi:outer membrane protein OmpA-like peptidoglycan-associated protein
MNCRSVTCVIAALTGFALLLAAAAGCTLVSAQGRASQRDCQILTGSAQPPSLLALILGSTSAQARARLSSAVLTTARTGEQVVVFGSSGTMLGDFRSPPPPEMTAPCIPSRPGGDLTSFQLAQNRKARAQALASTAQIKAVLQLRERQALHGWAGQVVERAWSAAKRSAARPPNLTRAIAAATTSATALQQSGGGYGDRLVLGLIGVRAAAGPPLHLDASLAGMTVVLTGISDGLADASWQAALLQAGAVRAYILPSEATGSVTSGLISKGLSGRAGIPFTVTGLDYSAGQYAVPRKALPSLQKLVRLLTIGYPTATATISAYTDNVPVPGGNRLLSWRRAQKVLAWLVNHGVAADRLQAIGYGSADPVAPNKPAGQPLNRRVEVVVSPTG